MKNISRHVGTLSLIDRLPNSYHGNPRYKVMVAGFTCRTAVDSMVAYSLPSYLGQRVEVTIGSHYGVATLGTIKLA